MGIEGHDIRADVRPLGGIAPYGIQMFAPPEGYFFRRILRQFQQGKPGLPDFGNMLPEIQMQRIIVRRSTFRESCTASATH